MRNLFFVLLTVAFCGSLSAQQSSELGLLVGLSTYQGDLVPAPFSADETNLAFGLQYRRLFSPRWALKLGTTFAKISGSDIDVTSRQQRGVIMENNLIELAAQVEWHPMGEARFPFSGEFNRTFSPYLGVGLGMVFTSQDLTIQGDRPFVVEDNNQSFIIMPIDLGLRLHLSPVWTATLSVGTRATFSDLLDGVSANSSTDANDWYLLGGLGVYYTFR